MMFSDMSDLTICTPWATADDLCAQDDAALIESATAWIPAASDLLNQFVGGQFPGVCEQTLRPCQQPSGYDSTFSRMNDAVPRGINRYRAWGFSSGCGCRTTCGCGIAEVRLGAYPVREIVSVVVDGTELDPSEYRLDEHRTLVRLTVDGHNPGWPVSQNLSLSDDDVGAWAVTFLWGRMPPPQGVSAAAVLAVELALGCRPDLADRCRLPRQATSISGEGVAIVLNPSDFLDPATGKLGIWEVDSFVAAYNPNHVDRNGSVWTPRTRVGRFVSGSGS